MGGGESQFVFVSVGRIRGGRYLQRRYNAATHYRQIKRTLTKFLSTDNPNAFTEDAVIEAVCAMSTQERADNVKLFRSVVRDMQKLVERLNDFRSFFAEDNLRNLDTWGRHPKNNLGFTVTINEGRVTIRRDWENKLTLLMPPRVDVPTPTMFDEIILS